MIPQVLIIAWLVRLGWEAGHLYVLRSSTEPITVFVVACASEKAVIEARGDGVPVCTHGIMIASGVHIARLSRYRDVWRHARYRFG